MPEWLRLSKYRMRCDNAREGRRAVVPRRFHETHFIRVSRGIAQRCCLRVRLPHAIWPDGLPLAPKLESVPLRGMWQGYRSKRGV
jgi:hypothetical protein